VQLAKWPARGFSRLVEAKEPPMTEAETNATRRGLLASATVGGLLLAAGAGRAEAAEWTAAEKANVKVVNDFLDSVRPKDMSNLVRYLSPVCVYRMTETLPPDKGYDAITQRLRPLVDSADRIEFQVLATYAAGPIVINHRIDKFTSPTHPLLFEGVGVFFLQGGKIKEWTDYTIRAALANQWPAA
jgi:limonene-1,2-epoxide hydrolase